MVKTKGNSQQLSKCHCYRTLLLLIGSTPRNLCPIGSVEGHESESCGDGTFTLNPFKFGAMDNPNFIDTAISYALAWVIAGSSAGIGDIISNTCCGAIPLSSRYGACMTMDMSLCSSQAYCLTTSHSSILCGVSQCCQHILHSSWAQLFLCQLFLWPCKLPASSLDLGGVQWCQDPPGQV